MSNDTEVSTSILLKALWERVLNREIADSNPNFFALGGHSLMAIELISLIAEKFAVEISMKDILEHPFLEVMANFLENQAQISPIEVNTRNLAHDDGTFPLTPNQQHLWNLISLFPQNPTHNISNAIRIKKNLKSELINKVINNIFKNNDSLRIRFVRRDNKISQRVFEHENISVEIIPIKEVNIISRLEEEMSHLFDLENERLIKLKLFQLSEYDYIFFFMAHHIVWDGITNIIFFNTFLEEYENLERGMTSENEKKKKLTASYQEYVNKQEQYFKSKEYLETLHFWKDRFSSLTSAPQINRDFDGLIHDYRSTVSNYKIDLTLLQKADAYVKERHISLYNLFFTCFHILLFERNFSELQIIGTPIHGRSERRFRKTLGYFINTLPFVHRLDRDKTLRENVDLVIQNLAESFYNQDIPFEHILKRTNASQLLSNNSLFQTLFIYLDVTEEMKVFEKDEFDLIKIDRKASHCEIDFYLYKAEKEVDVIIEYRSNLFKKETIENFFASFVRIIEKVVQNDSLTLNELIHFEKKNTTKYLELIDLNLKSHSPIPLFLDVISKNLESQGSKLAIEGTDFSYSYETLKEKVDNIASFLIYKGVTPQEVVGVYLKRDENLVPALLAILKIGAIYLPLDPSFPIERLTYMIDKSQSKIILATKKLKKPLVETSVCFVEDATISQSTGVKMPHLLGESSAYLLFTSGSTGRPKGVEVTHENISHFLASMKISPGMTFQDKLLSVTTISFDISVLEIFLPLYTGASFYLASKTEAIDPNSLRTIIKNRDITLMQATPVTWRMIMNSSNDHFPELKVLCGGEPLDKSLADSLVSRSKEVWNMYGPTETTVWSSVKRIIPDEKISIGKPVLNTYFLILDENFKHLPVGVQGRLFIGGKGVTKGYFKDPELTLSKFIVHPEHKSERIYDTGDIAYYDENAEVICLGRVDDQIKIRGYRIELSEIEQVLLNEESIFEAACKVINEELYAFVSIKEGVLKGEEDFLLLLKRKLPSYMIPRQIIILKELSKTPNGKIDRKKLSIQQDLFPLKSTSTKNAEIQMIIMEIWKKHLQVQSIEMHESFFNLGGHSLKALDIFNSINNYFNIDLNLSSIFEHHSIEKLASLVQDKINSRNLSLKDFKHIVRIHENSQTSKSIFCFHGVGGNVLNYYPLAQVLKDYHFYGVQSAGLNGKDRVYPSMQEMARAYINEIKLVQPRGPYLLAGGSMGGMIALEVAIQLQQAGDETENILMFDTFGPGLKLEEEKSVTGTIYEGLLSRCLSKLRHLFFLAQVLFHRIKKQPLPHSVRYQYIQYKNLKAMRSFAPQAYDQPVTLIKAKTKLTGSYQDPYLGWKSTLSGDFQIFETEGDHESFIEGQEFLETLSSLMKKSN